ncbi:MAG: hypothetical protein LBM01_01775 [Christensenellaceae bacterium]|jgi:rubrerythrin|nr:hypothetical protein [Christensenellaceae bacterium]
MTINEICAEIAKNNKGEQDAIEGYYRLISELESNSVPYEFIKQIEEIISDEMNHSEKLSNWATRLSNIQPAKD